MLKRLWHDPVWSKVIATGIVGTVGLAASYVFGWLPLICSSARRAVAYLGSATPVANWLLAVLGVGILFALANCANAIRKRREPWRQYTEDTFHGYKWRWEYDDAGKLVNLRSFCPTCDFEITDDFGKNWSDQYSARHTCPHCDSLIEPLGDKRHVWNEVTRLIEKNIRAKVEQAGNGCLRQRKYQQLP